MPRVLAFGASNSSTSINKRFATYAAQQLKEFDHTIVDLRDYELPLFSVDLERENGHPENVKNFAELIESHDGIIISLAEYNSNVTSAFKNLEDWVSRLEGPTWRNKNVFLLSTSNGKRGGQSAMDISLKILPYRGAQVVSNFTLPEFSKNFSDSEGILNEELNSVFQEQLNIFRQSLMSTTPE